MDACLGLGSSPQAAPKGQKYYLVLPVATGRRLPATRAFERALSREARRAYAQLSPPEKLAVMSGEVDFVLNVL